MFCDRATILASSIRRYEMKRNSLNYILHYTPDDYKEDVRAEMRAMDNLIRRVKKMANPRQYERPKIQYGFIQSLRLFGQWKATDKQQGIQITK